MEISTRGHKDVLVKYDGDNIIDFTKSVVRYANSTDCSPEQFLDTVCVENVTLKEAAEIYATVCRSTGTNVIRFEERRVDHKVIRFPLWREEALGV